MKENHKNLTAQWMLNIVLLLISCCCLLPFILLVISSITDETTILRNGYSFIPEKISFSAYEYLLLDAHEIFRAYGITIGVTVIGTVASLLITSMLAYPISRRDMPFGNILSFIVLFTMLFNGGLVTTYIVYTQLFHIKNTYWALIIPNLLVSAFYVMLMRAFFRNSIPAPVIESAKIDGAGEFRIFYQIVLPLSLPVLATIGLFQTIHYWNDWYNGLIYITDSKYFSLQNVLNRILLDIQFLTSTDMGNVSTDISNLPTEAARMAMAVIGIIPILIAYPFFQKFFVKGLTVGAVKG